MTTIIINDFSNETECIYEGERYSGPMQKKNSIGNKAPHLLTEWHSHKNSILPSQVTYSSNKKVWWQCKKGHEWQATPGNRFSGTGCPFCDGRRVTVENNLAIAHPLLALKWNYEKNHNLKPENIKPGSSRKVWWKCEKGHEWEKVIKDMVTSKKCPYCIGRRVSLENNFSAKCSHLINEWYEINDITPYQVTSGSRRIVSWKCKFGHIWKATISSRTRGHGCPKCKSGTSKLEVRLYSEFRHLFPDTLWREKIKKREIDVYIPSYALAIETDGWYWHKSEESNSADRSKSALLRGEGMTLVRVMDDRLKVKHDDHAISYKKGEDEYGVIERLLEYLIGIINFSDNDQIKIKEYIKEKGYVNGKFYESIMQALPGPAIENSVLSLPVLLSEWHYEKNALSPSQFSLGSKSRVWWLCKNGHEWEAMIGSRSLGRKCPYCTSKKASKENNLLSANPELAKEFHPIKNSPFIPDQIMPKSGKKVWWLCGNGHEWVATVGNRYNGSGCPYCSGKKPSSNHNLAIKFPELIKQWHPEKNHPLIPLDVTPKSSKLIWWVCERGHEWQTRVEKRTRGHGCHVCCGYKNLQQKL